MSGGIVVMPLLSRRRLGLRRVCVVVLGTPAGLFVSLRVLDTCRSFFCVLLWGIGRFVRVSGDGPASHSNTAQTYIVFLAQGRVDVGYQIRLSLS